ncbi:hypothetical protein BJX64DRAFT_283306 [Aspergillus heterothallicus]
MASLHSQIGSSINNTRVIAELLPEILASEDEATYLRYILEQSAVLNHVQTYEVVTRKIFNKAGIPTVDVGDALVISIERHHESITDDLLGRVAALAPLPGAGLCLRSRWLPLALEAATRVRNFALAKRILQVLTDGDAITCLQLSGSFKNACEANHAEMVTMILGRLLAILETMKKTFQDLGIDSDTIEKAAWVGGKALESGLKVNISHGYHDLTRIFLATYLECNPYSSRDIIAKVRDEEFASISREKCLDLLSKDLEDVIRLRIMARLQPGASGPYDVRLSTADGQTFQAHKDVLAFWPPYFAGLFGSNWTDHDHVTF